MSSVTSFVPMSTSPSWLTEVFTNAALTDMKITQQYPFQTVTGAVKTQMLIIGKNIYTHNQEGWSKKRAQALHFNNNHLVWWVRKKEGKKEKHSSFVLFFFPGDFMTESATRVQCWDQKAEWGLSIINCTYCIPRADKNSLTKRLKSHNHQKTILSCTRGGEGRKTNMSSAGSPDWRDKSVES